MKQPIKDAAALDQARSDLQAALEEVDRLTSEKRELASQLAARFVEVATLTRIARRAEDERDAASEAQQQTASTNAELETAIAAHGDELARMHAAHVNEIAAFRDARDDEFDRAYAVHTERFAALENEFTRMQTLYANELAGLQEELAAARQAAGLRSQSALAAIIRRAPWRWLPRRMRVSVLSPLVRRTGLIDEDWYADRYKDISAQRIDPVRHFIAHGAKEGRFPNSDAAFANGNDATDAANRIETV